MWRGRNGLYVTCPDCSPSLRDDGRILEAETEAEPVEKYSLLTVHHSLLSLLIPPRTTCPRVTPPTISCALPHILLLIQKTPTDLPSEHTGSFTQLSLLPPETLCSCQVDRMPTETDCS